MALALDPTERRIVGTLVEKELSVPETYPLTVNALVAGCNQKNNREPLSSYPEHEIEGALQALMERGWVLEHEKAGGRTRRYAHKAREQLSVDEAELAILTELWLRGPQSAPELEKRASRMRPVGDAAAVERRLQALAARPVPYVRFLGRRPGERVPRWEHTFATEGSREVAEGGDLSRLRPQIIESLEIISAPPQTRPPSSPAAPSDPRAPLAALASRLQRLEREVAALRDELARLQPPDDEPEASP